jgi:hypothetical protein
MRFLFSATLCCALGLGLVAAQNPPAATPARAARVRQAERIRLLIQGDDMGAAHAINLATIQAYKEGILRSTNVIVPAPWFLDAVELLKANPGLDVGVHLCLTSEWSRVKWRPVTNAPSLVDADGYFFPMVWTNKAFPPGTSLKEAQPKDAEVEAELRRQIEIARKYLPRISYLSVHMGFTMLRPEWAAIVRKLGAENGLPVLGAEPGMNYLGDVWRSGAGANFDVAALRGAKLAARIEKLRPGTWLMIDHCGLDDAEMQALGHPGYENVAADRDAVRAAWSDPRVIEVVKRRGIELIGHADLPKLAVR